MATSAANLSTREAAPLRPVKLGRLNTVVETRADGTIYLRCAQSLPQHPATVTESLDRWATERPDQTYLAQRGADGAWRKLTYKQVRDRVRAIAAALLSRGLSAERPIAILSGNDIEHALLALAAMYVGIPYAPISPAYSLMSGDFGRLRGIVELLTPGLVFASDGAMFGKAIASVIPADTELVVARNASDGRKTLMFDDLGANSEKAVDAAHAKVAPDTIAKFLFTSGSTGTPKGVINTHRMLTANQAMIAACYPFFADEPPVLVDWLPWSHTFGGNYCFGLALTNGGTLHIDDGNPTPPGVPKTVRNLTDVAPNIYFNVPKGYEALVAHLRDNEAFRKNFFSKLKVLFYAGAALSQPCWDDLERLSIETTGERVIFLSALGSTETSPLATACTWEFERAGNIGLPCPQVELKLAPNEGKLEARFRGPHITPGYWRQPDITREAFDEEGFYRIGDALKFADPNEPNAGLLFDGRIAEDFKLSTGTWVSVGPLRGQFLEFFAPYVRDVVFAGSNEEDIAALVIPDIEACRRLCPDLPKDAAPAAIFADPRTRLTFASLINELADRARGSSTRVCRLLVMAEPPSIDSGEMTDKGSINQRAVLRNRAALVKELYDKPYSSRVIGLDDPQLRRT
ncbi:MAG: feruloyl-CoA synthase [Xanthobacteraceae bacterium]|uniref:feruloyl-CoA synthase n=1 Tax=Pseudolabrys sp. TaxID=1960880 RepID=UPI003D12DCF6